MGRPKGSKNVTAAEKLIRAQIVIEKLKLDEKTEKLKNLEETKDNLVKQRRKKTVK